MAKMTVEAFITKYGTIGLFEAMGDKVEGFIVRDNDYVSVAELRENLTYLNGEPYWHI